MSRETESLAARIKELAFPALDRAIKQLRNIEDTAARHSTDECVKWFKEMAADARFTLVNLWGTIDSYSEFGEDVMYQVVDLGRAAFADPDEYEAEYPGDGS